MPADTETNVESQAQGVKRAAKAAVAKITGGSEEAINEALEAAERTIREAAKRMEAAVRESVAALRDQSEPYRDIAGERFDEAQKYLVERVKERPVTAALAGLGVGLLLGLLLAGRNGK
jgi:ElaB/YqjD/DUF883 family membrane-anchored ribosome-binding protein